MESFQPNYVKQVEGNGYNRNQRIAHKERIAQIVEPPLIKACEELYDKNIMTLESSANIFRVQILYN